MTSTYIFDNDDLYKVLEFVVNYHLNPTKGSRGRTNQGKRSFGGELDEFIPGKLIEIAVSKILGTFKPQKKLYPDFEIYSNKEVGDRADPDITSVLEEQNKRPPNLFLEIKRLDPDARWLGPRGHQLKEIHNGYMIHASLEFDDSRGKKERDVTASILKLLLNSTSINLKNFSNFSDLKAKINFIYPFSYIQENGQFFKKGSIIPENDFPESQLVFKSDGSLRKGFQIVKDFTTSGDLFNSSKLNKTEIEHQVEMKIEKQSKNDPQTTPPYGKWKIKGSFLIVKKVQYEKEFIHCQEPTIMFNKIFGTFNLDAGKTYRFHFKNTLGKGTFKGIDDYWFSKKRLLELIETDESLELEKQMKTIIEKI